MSAEPDELCLPRRGSVPLADGRNAGRRFPVSPASV